MDAIGCLGAVPGLGPWRSVDDVEFEEAYYRQQEIHVSAPAFN
jgi:hypothetical protein